MARLILFIAIMTVIFGTIVMAADSIIRMVSDARKEETEEETAI